MAEIDLEVLAAALPRIQKQWLRRAVVAIEGRDLIVSSRMAECMRYNLVRKGIITGGRRSMLTKVGSALRARLMEGEGENA